MRKIVRVAIWGLLVYAAIMAFVELYKSSVSR